MCMNLKKSPPFPESAGGLTCTITMLSSRCWVHPNASQIDLKWLLEGPWALRCGAYFRCKNLGRFVSQITQEKYIEGANAIFWLPQRWEPVQKPEHSFLLKKKKKNVIHCFSCTGCPVCSIEKN